LFIARIMARTEFHAPLRPRPQPQSQRQRRPAEAA
jgi:hypothetical protein